MTVSNLNRTYTGTTFDTSTIGISGGFNGDFNSSGIETSGNRYKLLRFYFKTSGAPDSDFSETLPINAGRYVIKITSDSDNNPNYLQNYTTLDSIQNMFEFEITPAVLRLDYNVDLKVRMKQILHMIVIQVPLILEVLKQLLSLIKTSSSEIIL